MLKPPVLKAGDCVEIIAPASRCTDKVLHDLKELLQSWQLNCVINDDIFGTDLLCANDDEIRYRSLNNALQNPEIKAVICARGGYGSMRLIPALSKTNPPVAPKWFVGMSDVTALHLFLAQHWSWSTIHGALAQDKFSPESIAAVKSLLFGEVDQIELSGVPLNRHAEQERIIDGVLTGGNLCLVQTSMGTLWEIEGKDKIILLEEVGERGYKVDRMLEHLSQVGVFKDAAAVIFGDFIEGNEPDGSSLVQPVLERFARSCDFPVVQIAGVGHGHVNLPVVLGAEGRLQLGKRIKFS